MQKKSKIYNYLTIVILLIAFIFMCLFASKQSFWIDELDWTIEYLNNESIITMLKGLLNTGFNLPLSYIIFYPIYKIAPYGELWLLLPCIVACIIGMYLIKKIGDKIGGNKFGLICLLCSVTSYIVIYQGAYELRPYALLFCFSALVLYRFLCLLENRNKNNIIFYTISLILLAYTHWFGCLIIVFYFLYELYLLIRKKSKITFLLPYIILGVTFLPWFILMIQHHTTNFTVYWAKPPTIRAACGIISYLLSGNLICKLLFIISGILFIIYFLLKKKEKIKFLWLCIFSIIFIILTTFIYSVYINPAGSLFVTRYFFELLPHTFIIMAFPLYELCELKFNKNLHVEWVIIILLFIIIGYQNYTKVINDSSGIYEPYREASEILVKNDIYTDDSIVITSISKTFLTYYFEKKGGKLPQNVFNSYSNTQFIKDGKIVNDINLTNEDLLKYNKIYIIEIHEFVPTKILDLIKGNYELTKEYQNYGLYIYKKNIH